MIAGAVRRILPFYPSHVKGQTKGVTVKSGQLHQARRRRARSSEETEEIKQKREL